jgi:hypothetical protein
MKHIQIFEFFNSDVNHLMKYLKMSDEERDKDIAYNYAHYLLKPFLDDIGGIENEQINNLLYDDPISAVELLEENFPEVYDDYVDFAHTEMNSQSVYIDDTEKPSWYFLDFIEVIKRDTWLVHVTSEENAYNISKNGFNKGVNDLSKLGLTVFLSDYDKQFGGYNFAYTINDFLRYGLKPDYYTDFKYGTTPVVFRAAGIKCYHNGDEENQVIFWGNTASDIHIIEKYTDRYDDDDIDVKSEFLKSKPTLIKSFISANPKMDRNIVSDLLRLSKNIDFLSKIKEWNPRIYSDIEKYYVSGFESSKFGEWLTYKNGKEYASNDIKDVIGWITKNNRIVK